MVAQSDYTLLLFQTNFVGGDAVETAAQKDKLSEKTDPTGIRESNLFEGEMRDE